MDRLVYTRYLHSILTILPQLSMSTVTMRRFALPLLSRTTLITLLSFHQTVQTTKETEKLITTTSRLYRIRHHPNADVVALKALRISPRQYKLLLIKLTTRTSSNAKRMI